MGGGRLLARRAAIRIRQVLVVALVVARQVLAVLERAASAKRESRHARVSLEDCLTLTSVNGLLAGKCNVVWYRDSHEGWKMKIKIRKLLDWVHLCL